MTDDEINNLAAEYGDELDQAFIFNRIGRFSAVAFARAVEAATLERAGDLLTDALQADLENGVKWLNEAAADKFLKGYPELSAAIGKINDGNLGNDK